MYYFTVYDEITQAGLDDGLPHLSIGKPEILTLICEIVIINLEILRKETNHELVQS